MDFSPQIGHEQAGSRPGLVISPLSYNAKTNLAMVCPITSKSKNYSFEAPIISNDIKGVALLDQISSIDWERRNIKYVSRIKLKDFERLLLKLRMFLEIRDF